MQLVIEVRYKDIYTNTICSPDIKQHNAFIKGYVVSEKVVN